MRLIFLAIIALVFQGCSGCGCGCSGKSGGYKVGIDPSFFPEDFKDREPYVLGYLEQIMLEVSKQQKISFVTKRVNWDGIMDGLKQEKYDAVISSIIPQNFNEKLYDFSVSLLDIGPILVVPENSKAKSLKDLSGKAIGIIDGNEGIELLSQYPDVIMRRFENLPDLFHAFKTQMLDGAVIDRIDAVSYIQQYFLGKLLLIDEPLTPTALRFITKHEEGEYLLYYINKTVEKLKKKGKLKKMQQAWELAI